MKSIILIIGVFFQLSAFAQLTGQDRINLIRNKYEIESKFKVFVWNLYMLKHISKQSLQRNQIDQLILDSDFLLFQEIIVNKNFIQSDLQIDDFNFFQTPYLKREKDYYLPNNDSNGFMTASRVEAIRNEVIIGNSIDLADSTQSMAIISEYRIKDERKTLLIIHIHNGVSLFRTLDLLKMLNPIIENHDGPILVAGDFNSFLFKKYYVKKWAKKLNLNDSHVETPFFFKNIKMGQLDHAFYRGLKLIDDVQVIKKTKALSDHIGYSLQFSLENTTNN